MLHVWADDDRAARSLSSSGLQGKLHYLLNYLTAPRQGNFLTPLFCRKLPPMKSGLLDLELYRTMNNAFLLFANHEIQVCLALFLFFLM